MDDLAGLDWNSRSKEGSIPKPAYAFPALKPTPPVSGRASPLHLHQSNPASKPATPGLDSFSNLVPFTSSSANNNISLQEQQKRLGELKLQQQLATVKQLQKQYSGVDDAFWNNLGSGRSTPANGEISRKRRDGSSIRDGDEDDEDIFATLNAAATTKTDNNAPIKLNGKELPDDDDDDPFELSAFQAKTAKRSTDQSQSHADDDVLGLLGEPVLHKPKPKASSSAPITSQRPPDTHPQDAAIAELVDMGFPAGKARQALETTDSGMDVQAAVSWLLNQAHSEARSKTQAKAESRNAQSAQNHKTTPFEEEIQRRREQQSKWQQDEFDDSNSISQRRDSRPGLGTDREPGQTGTDFRSNFLKTAGSLWKESTKRVQQVVQEFNSDSESSQPKWLRSESISNQVGQPPREVDEFQDTHRRRRSSANQKSQQVTDEALMLESSRPAQSPKKPSRARPETRFDSSADSSRDHSPALPSRLRDELAQKPTFLSQRQQTPPIPTKPTLTRQAIEDQAAQAYVSSARRRKPASQPTPSQSVAAIGSDLLGQSSNRSSMSKAANASPSTSLGTSNTTPVPKPSASPVRPPPPTRKIPSVSAPSLKASHLHREKGNDHFKRGDYASAHQSYTTSTSHLPSDHPINVILLTNRALTGLKIGEPKTSIIDSDRVISLIGSSKGESETVDLGNGQPPKQMREYYGKALMRKAEALEQMERWTEAAVIWREAVEGGHGGSSSIQARIRAEKAANPETKKPKPPPAKKPVINGGRYNVSHVNGHRSESAAAVNRLRAANAAAEKTDDEKFALSDSVEARITTWKGTKADNLRALLSSLDTVLWPEAGWKKISMADLVLPGKVKIQYMKGIAKVHPDKIPTNATTEQRMIAGAVFSILNEAWEKFRTENGL